MHDTEFFVSIHTPHAERDPKILCPIRNLCSFNPHAPCGARLSIKFIAVLFSCFNPHAPCGARLYKACKKAGLPIVSIHTPHAERDIAASRKALNINVSIHTPHAERDDGVITPMADFDSFNPHAPCGARPTMEGEGKTWEEFQSTRPMRSATY